MRKADGYNYNTFFHPYATVMPAWKIEHATIAFGCYGKGQPFGERSYRQEYIWK